VLGLLAEVEAGGGGRGAQFAVPELRVGTLDALLALSDDLLKTCSAAEQATGKVSRLPPTDQTLAREGEFRNRPSGEWLISAGRDLEARGKWGLGP